MVTEFKQVGIANTLRSCSLFAGIAAAEIGEIAAITVVKSVPKGTYLFHEKDPSVGLFVVQTGAINFHRVTAAGKERVIRFFRAGDSFAEGTLCSDHGYPGHARAVESSQVLLVQKPGILALMRRQPELALRLLDSLNSQLRLAFAQLEDLTAKDVSTRLANWLLQRSPNPASDQPARIELGISKRVLAAELGTVSETFSRALAKFREQKLVAVKGKTITLLAPLKLTAMLQQHSGS